MTDAQIKLMVDRFLAWKLPKNFSPDGGINYMPSSTSSPVPTGTNLFDAQQANEMVRYMLAGVEENPEHSVEEMIRKAAVADHLAAQQYAQAALNAANALCSLRELKK